MQSDDGTQVSAVSRDDGYAWICTGCKKVITSRPFGPCHDCGHHFRTAKTEDLQCDRCGDDDGQRLMDRTGEYDRLCRAAATR